MGSIANYILTLHGPLVLFLVFLLPAAESSIFLGFIFPGETVVIVAGVLAFEHRESLILIIFAASLGAIFGDSVGYFIGKRWGRSLINNRLSRFVKPTHIARAEEFMIRRGGPGVFIGRFTTTLRVLVPGLAGVAGMRYKTFVIFNVAGGIVWSVSMAMLGYLAGQSYKQVEKVAGQVSYALLALAVVAVIVFVIYRKRKEKAIDQIYEEKMKKE
ncbi:MAG: DedA family protein [Acidimicrobiaceae bacterium]|nr:DedA family protein [Acidimicrobiaceae bacterium]